MAIDLTKIIASAFASVGSAVSGVIKPITYRYRSGAQTYNPITGQTSGTSQDYLISGIFLNYNRMEKDTDFQASKRLPIELGDVKCLIAWEALQIEPTLEDLIIDGTKTWRIVNHGLDPTGRALHTFQLRQS